MLVGCNPEITTIELQSQDVSVESGYLVENPQDGTILHAWNWSMSTVEEHLEDIAIAGFSAIQVSPMQPQKDYFGASSWGASWWKLYQPLGFSIATENHSLGTKTDLESLCNAADEYGIKIIVDVVANHLAGGDMNTFNKDVAIYEPEIYNQNLMHFSTGYANDSSIFQVTQLTLGGFPDLETESDIVQNRVLDLLKGYVDVGVDGFRFDAAKHIETPSDGEYASNFWPTVINGVNDYANSLGKPDLYIYGEILNTAGTGRSYTDYTDYMSVTDNGLSDNIRNAVLTKNAERLLTSDYISGVPADKALLWAESHDTFASDSTASISNQSIIKTYAIDASRKGATSLYFVRPNDQTFMGECGSYNWQSKEVSSINKFHNYFVNGDEELSVSNGFFLNQRYIDDKSGVVIIDIEGNGDVNKIPVDHIPDGSYLDQVSQTYFTVKNSKISGTVGDSGIAVVYNNEYKPKPVVYVSDDGSHGSFSDTKTITVYSYNTTEAYYSINDGENIAFSGNTEIELSHPDLNATVTLDLELWYDDYKIERHFEYLKSNIVVTEVTVNNIDQTEVGDSVVVAWVWAQSEEGRWVEGNYDEGVFTFGLEEGDGYFLLVTFPNATTIYDWVSNLSQTNDVEIPVDGIYDGSQLIWN